MLPEEGASLDPSTALESQDGRGGCRQPSEPAAPKALRGAPPAFLSRLAAFLQNVLQPHVRGDF